MMKKVTIDFKFLTFVRSQVHEWQVDEYHECGQEAKDEPLSIAELDVVVRQSSSMHVSLIRQGCADGVVHCH